MRKLILLPLLCTTILGATASTEASSVNNMRLREACVRWFSPADATAKINRNPQWRRLLEGMPRKQMLNRVEKLRSGRVHSVEYCAMSFVLAFFGREPVKNTKEMLASFDMRRSMPPNVYGGSLNDPRVFGVKEENLGLYDSTTQLYQRQRSDELLHAILSIKTDGEAGHFRSYVTQQLFSLYPSDVLRVTSKYKLHEHVGFALGAENARPESTRRSLLRMQTDRRVEIRRAAARVLQFFDRLHLASVVECLKPPPERRRDQHISFFAYRGAA